MQTKFHAVLFGTGLSFALGLLACGSTKMTKTGEAQPPREKGCDFEIFTATPATGYTEIGAIDVNWGAYGTNAYRDIESFKKKIQPHVCEAGGDAAIAYANGDGYYIKATILKSAPESEWTDAPAATSSPQAPTGCQHDTQCKGDRICESGQCVSPPPKEPAAVAPTPSSNAEAAGATPAPAANAQ